MTTREKLLKLIEKENIEKGQEIDEYLLDCMFRESDSLKKGDGSIIFCFVDCGNISAVRKLILDYMVDVNIRDEYGATPLTEACHTNYYDVIKFLLENGADPDMIDGDGRTAYEIYI